MKYFPLLYILIICSCSNHSRLNIALEFAGSNRKELEKVLLHYKDSGLKYNAACFLIENMPYYFSYDGWQLDTMKCLKKSGMERYIRKEVREKWEKLNFNGLNKIYDSHVITADYLIDNINLAFHVWETTPWGKNISFDDFCELILPYRIGEEPLEAWRSTYHNTFKPILDSLYTGTDIVEAGNAIKNHLTTNFIYIHSLKGPRVGPGFLLKYPNGTCKDGCDYHTYAMRALGFPVTTDIYHYSPENHSSHQWNVLRDTTGNYLSFFLSAAKISREQPNDGRKKGKVYRMYFGIQPTTIKKTSESNIPASLKNPFLKDVTAEYFGANNYTINITKTPAEKHAYLGVFSTSGWIPVDFTKVKSKDIIVENIEPYVIFVPIDFNGYNYSPIGYPFQLEEKGIKYFQPDTNKRITATLYRKYPLRQQIRTYMDNVYKSRIEGSLNSGFEKADLLYEINEYPESNYNLVYPVKTGKYRYIRYIAQENSQAEIAELEFYNTETAQDKLNTTVIYGDEPHTGNNNRNKFKVNDNNYLTFFRSEKNGGQVVLDLGKPYEIKKIVYVPRNDENFITIGDNYELFYQDGIHGWKSLGQKTATERYLKYDNIPDNSLLWLRNLTKGREEQVFYLENGKQSFVEKLSAAVQTSSTL